MRILHTALRYPPASGGVETYVQQIVERTRDIKAGRDVRVLTSSLRTHGPISQLEASQLIDDPMYVQRLRTVATPWLSYPRLLGLEHYLGHHRPNILHSYSFWYQPADVTARYAKKYHLPFFFHPIYYENTIRQKLAWQVYKKTIGHKTFAAADVVIVISPQEKELIVKAGFAVKRFELIPPGIDEANFTSGRLNPFLKRGIRGRVIITVSRLAPGKRLQDAVSAMPNVLKQHPDAHLAIIGEDFGSRAGLEADAKQLGVSQHVHFLGRLPDEELRAAYEHADIMLHTSEYEAFGITLAESLAAGTPVVARNVGAVSYVVPDGLAGFLFDTTDGIASHINTLLSDEGNRLRLGRQGREHVSKNFTWDKSITTLKNLYNEFTR
ncbi:MAG: glycosyltransferase family 4 protein [Candidatus Andersenbacteria bacterium]|nr:glycosyltransferase family 4 protein [Candidatus Andersenbacteria bacterium]